MKNAIIISFLIFLSFAGFSQVPGGGLLGTNVSGQSGQGSGGQGNVDEDGNAIDPLDNYIDPATQLDYTKELEKLNEDQVKVVFERCVMFTIQNEMGQSGEDTMSPTEIDAYENLVASKCKCVQDGNTWVKESNVLGECKEDPPAEKDLLVHTMDLCVERLGLTDDNCKNNMTSSCTNDFRYQCYQYMTQPHEFSEKSDPILDRCDFDDQTKSTKLECRSYCYVRNECDIPEGEFSDKKIGNIYLLSKKSRSSCVKGSTYGIHDDNTMWVSNSCHGDFAVQYKDPKCGYRPTCNPRPHEIDNIAESGNQTLQMVCNGETNETGGKHFCSVVPFKLDENGKVTNEPDPSKEVTYVQDLKLVNKIGAAKCNAGGNGSAIDYSPRNKGLDGGWGIETQRLCHATFEVKVKWKRKLCTMAGKETNSRDTCCYGLYWDPDAKTCNVPAFVPPEVEDESNMVLDYSANKCAPTIPENVQNLANKYFAELGNYENMFALIDGSTDAISSIMSVDDELAQASAKAEIESAKNDQISAIESTFTEKTTALESDTVKTAAQKEEEKAALQKERDDALAELEQTVANEIAEKFPERSESELEAKKSTFDAIKLVHDAAVRFRTDWTQAKLEFRTIENELARHNAVYQDYIKKVDENKVTPEDEALMENNMFKGMDLQAATNKSQTYAKAFQIAYIETVKEKMDQYQADLEKAAHAGQNLAWYCAHTENCSENNWLIRDKTKEEVVDFLHDAPHPYKLVEPRGRRLPKLAGVNKLLVDIDKYNNFESASGAKKGYGVLEEMNKFFSYQSGKVEDVPAMQVEGDNGASNDADRVLNLFRQYTQEFPLREDSLFKDNEILKGYLAGAKEGVNSGGLPQYCEQQDDYQVRVPIGKAIEPMRMVQITRVLKKFYALYQEAYQANEDCLVALDADRDANTSRPDLKLNLDNRAQGIGNDNATTVEDRRFSEGFNGDLLGHMTSTFGDVAPGSFMDNLLSNGAKGGNLTNVGSSNLSALRKKNADREKKLVSRRINRKKDKSLDNYVKSLGSTFGATLKKQNRDFASLSPSGVGANGLGGIGGNKAIGKSSRSGNGSSTLNNGNSGSRSGYGSRRGGSRSRNRGNSNYGAGMGAQSGSGSGSNSNDHILSNIDDKKFDTNESDSIFDIVTKRYIRTAYPVLLDKRKKEGNE